MRTTVEIDDDVLAAARTLAAERGISLGLALSELARGGLRPVASQTEGGLPVFAVSADAPVMTPEDVSNALEES